MGSGPRPRAGAGGGAIEVESPVAIMADTNL